MERVVVRRTLCIKQRVLWLEEVFCNPLTLVSVGLPWSAREAPPADGDELNLVPVGEGELPSPEGADYNMLNNFTRAYLTCVVSAGRKFDPVTFFYFQTVTGTEPEDESRLARKEHISRGLPPTLDVLIPRYLVIFVDCIGHRKQLYKENATWHTLERAVVMSTSYWRSDHDLSPIITFMYQRQQV